MGEDRECEQEVEQKRHGPADEGAKPNLWNKLRFRIPMEAMAGQNAGPAKKAHRRHYETGRMGASNQVVDDDERQNGDNGGDDPSEIATARQPRAALSNVDAQEPFPSEKAWQVLSIKKRPAPGDEAEKKEIGEGACHGLLCLSGLTIPSSAASASESAATSG